MPQSVVPSGGQVGTGMNDEEVIEEEAIVWRSAPETEVMGGGCGTSEGEDDDESADG